MRVNTHKEGWNLLSISFSNFLYMSSHADFVLGKMRQNTLLFIGKSQRWSPDVLEFTKQWHPHANKHSSFVRMFIPGVWILLPAPLGYSQLLFTTILCYRTRRLETSKPLVQYHTAMDLSSSVNCHTFYTQLLRLLAQVDKKLSCVFTPTDSLRYFIQPPPHNDW